MRARLASVLAGSSEDLQESSLRRHVQGLACVDADMSGVD